MKMMLIEWLFLLLVTPGIEGSLKLWKPNDFSVEGRVTKKILETCYGDNNSKELVFILGNPNEFFDKVSVIRMNDLLNIDEDYESRQFSNIGVTKVIIIEDSPTKLHSDLISFKKTRWWNHMLPFFIIGKNDESCKNFKDILYTTWSMDILNSIYICSKSENTTLYTLNPITNYAPDPWERMEELNDSNIYHQVFDLDTSCINLNYDKTKVLNGYLIKVDLPWFLHNLEMEVLIDRLNEFPIPRLFQLIIRQLNASLMYVMWEPGWSPPTHLEEHPIDVSFTGQALLQTTRLINLMPPVPIARYVVLVKSQEKTVLNKIRHLWSTQVLWAAAIALLILFSILAMKNDVSSAILDITRFLIYVSIQTDMRSNSFRIYFTTMLIFIVISNGVFQGKIAAFLTKPDKAPPVKTVEELEDSGYHFYTLHSVHSAVNVGLHPSESIITPVANDDTCVDSVLGGTLNACIIPLHLYQKKHLLKPLDLVQPRLGSAHSSNWKFRNNWPFYDHFNYMLVQAMESGIYPNWEKEEFYQMKEKRRADDHELALEEIEAPYRPIKLIKLDFAFRLLAIGLVLATIVLIVELRMREI